MYKRYLQNKILKRTNPKKAIIVIGARQVGKTTLIKTLLKDKNYLFLDGDNPSIRELLNNPNTEEIKTIIANHKTLFIDEAQRINNIGITIKIIIDQIKDVQVFVSGSSAFYLQNSLNETLTGRKWEYTLFPITWEEYQNKHSYLESIQQLENRILYGFYPEVLNNNGDEKAILKQLVNSYLYKDILIFSGIRKPDVLEKLLKALAFQIGNEVSYNELSQIVGIDKTTISKYIQILEQNHIIFRLPAYSKNLRNEIKRNQKIYFYDTGVRNTIINNFTPLSMRTDKGALWENFLLAERLKQNIYKETYTDMHFWRTKQQQEVDLVEINNGKITGFEIKWEAKKQIKLPLTFTKTYNAKSKIIDKNNFIDFVIIESPLK